jgi:serine/threonine-protein kinase ULK/ATG1
MEDELENHNFQIKIADLGFARFTGGSQLKSFCGTPLNMAPEVLEKKGYN